LGSDDADTQLGAIFLCLPVNDQDGRRHRNGE
jgi:hypothetical protein